MNLIQTSTAKPREDLRREVLRLWPETDGLAWTPLTPDGSDRSYHRLRDPATGASRVLMVYRGTNATSVEGFLEVHRLLAQNGLPVARLEAEAAAAGLFLIEDLGDETLEAAASRLGAGEIERLYHDAIELIARIQSVRAPDAPNRPRCFELAFDEAKLRFEIDFFFEHMVSGFLDVDAHATDAEAAREELYRLSSEIARSHPVLVHRDYHCRNLMVRDGKLRLIDYQDARLGRHSYDLASLIFDSYIDLDGGLRTKLLAHYERLMPDLPANWRTELIPSAIQRNIKALGSFGYLMGRKRKLHFASAVGITLRHLGRNLPLAEMPATSRFVLGQLTDRCGERSLLEPSR